MKKYFIVALFVLIPVSFAGAASDYFLKLDSIKGEAVRATTSTATPTTVVAPKTDPQRASTDYLIKIPPIEGETEGKVEAEWKVEEGTKAAAPGVEPDEIDVKITPEPITPDFGILLDGSSATAVGGAEAAQDVFVTEAMAADPSIESISFNFEKVTAQVRREVKLFGFIPRTTVATVEINTKNEVSVRFPWWTVFASNKESDSLGKSIHTMLVHTLEGALTDGLLMIRY